MILWVLPTPVAAVDAEYIVGPLVVGGVRLLSDDFDAIAEYETGFMQFGNLADFTGYRFTADDEIDEVRTYQYKLRDETMRGFRMGLRFRKQLDLVWSRLWCDSAYQVWMDGEEVADDPDAAISSQLPEVEVRLDMLILAWRMESYRFGAFVPTLRAGYGWTLMSQQGPFQLPYRPEVDNSQSADTFELAAGLEGNWRIFQVGTEIRGFTFRWESEDINVPASQVWSWMWSLRVGLAF
jgi:hypothetical protein